MMRPIPQLPMELIRNCRLLPDRGEILRYLPRDIVFCEVGVALGEFTRTVLDRCAVKHFIAIDTFVIHGWPEGWGGFVGRTLGDLDHRTFYDKRFRAEIDAGIMTILEGKSWDKVNELGDRSVDVFYVDADHTYDSVKADLVAIKSKIAPAGIIILNDYILAEGFGVIQAANEFMITEQWEMIYFAFHYEMYCDIAIRRMP